MIPAVECHEAGILEKPWHGLTYSSPGTAALECLICSTGLQHRIGQLV